MEELSVECAGCEEDVPVKDINEVKHGLADQMMFSIFLCNACKDKLMHDMKKLLNEP